MMIRSRGLAAHYERAIRRWRIQVGRRRAKMWPARRRVAPASWHHVRPLCPSRIDGAGIERAIKSNERRNDFHHLAAPSILPGFRPWFGDADIIAA